MALTTTVNPGDKIQSAWGNEIRDRSIQQFASIAERDSQWPTAPNGSLSMVGNRLYRKIAGAWWFADGPLWSTLSEPYAAAVTGGYWDYVVTFPTAPVACIATIDFTTICGYSSGALTSIEPQVFSNNYTSPAGGAWLVRGASTGPVNAATWRDTVPMILSIPVAAGVAPVMVMRIGWAPSTNNFHLRGLVRAQLSANVSV